MDKLRDRLLRRLSEDGPASTLRRGLASLLRVVRNMIYRNHVELLYSLPLAGTGTEATQGHLIVRDLVESDVVAVQEFIKKHNVHAEYGLKRFAYNTQHRYRAVLGTLDNEIVGYGWWTDNDHSHPSQTLHNIQLDDRELYVFDLFIAPPFRKNNMPLEFLTRAQSHARELGFHRLLAVILESNRRSLLLHRRAGFREIDRHRVHTLLGILMVYRRKVIIRNSLWF